MSSKDVFTRKLDCQLKREILFVCKDEASEQTIGNMVHDQLRGNPDYIDNNTILNLSKDDTERPKNVLGLYFFKECERIPDIGLLFNGRKPSDFIDMVIIKCRKDEGPTVRDSIYMQLAGCIDYSNNNIILNCSDDRRDGTEDIVYLVFKDYHQQEIPDIYIKGGN